MSMTTKMTAEDLTEADIGKWVKLRGKFVGFNGRLRRFEIEGDQDGWQQSRTSVYPAAVLEPCDPPERHQQVGDRFEGKGGSCYTIVAIAEGGCLLKRDDVKYFAAWSYPLPARYFTPINEAG